MSVNNTKICEFFDDFCNKVKSIYENEPIILEFLNKYLELSHDNKIELVNNFYSKFKCVMDGDVYLKNKKVKLFSSKDANTHQLSISLFGEDLPLKKIFNNLEGDLKNYLWTSLQAIVYYKVNNFETEPITKTKNSILDIEVDDNVNIMINDIIDEFKNTMKNNTNPMESILGITSKITDKYHDKLQSGEIKLDNLINDLQNKMPGVKDLMEKIIPKNKPKVKKEKVIIDENFSTDKVVTGEDKPEENNINLQKLLPMLNGLGGGDIGKLSSDIFGKEFGDMFSDMNINKVKNMNPEELKEMNTQMTTLMKDKFNIDLSKTKLP
ncbi:hypothetical protein crov450 [Cafeteria roenbergensis virus]|uniref:Uncharacterized protein n=1 Tax=Cafeteria roenbergensis virus (strain BV-PW1) TaxID=693272 RepID=E3T5M1_CROVB|nr:hypothetical protein crov450 [Cafeteria roenbergensis virus BV-PW1]ADO67484.1 hypothetical protein crov450 [Cafeteria roenbergensis virus BV-PW1]